MTSSDQARSARRAIPTERLREPVSRGRKAALVAYAVLLGAIFFKPLLSLVVYSAGNSLHSHVVLVPFISAYLVWLKRSELSLQSMPSFSLAAISVIGGLGALVAATQLGGSWLSQNDYLGLMAFSFICFVIGGGFFFLGSKGMRAVSFPFAFLLFMIPLPDRAADYLETLSKLASAEIAGFFFSITATPVLHDGVYFRLPGITIEVAKECSGIRSSWVLFITSLLAGHMFLRSPWRQAVLVAFVIPLGVIRNGFRILVVGLLCVHYGPQMIESIIHRRGGPLFFALSLLPLFGLLWWLRQGEAVTPAASSRPSEREGG